MKYSDSKRGKDNIRETRRVERRQREAQRATLRAAYAK